MTIAALTTGSLTAARRVLWVALVLNGGMFLTEIVAGLAAGSAALQSDAVDFLSDAANYGINLSVLGLVLVWRARAAIVKGVSMGLLGLWVVGSTLWHAVMAAAEVMGVVGVLALLVNGGVAFLLYRYRGGDSNMRSVWICSRNDAHFIDKSKKVTREVTLQHPL